MGQFVICLKCEILIIDTRNEYIQKSDKWLTCFSVVNLMLGCFLFKMFEKFHESCYLFLCCQEKFF